MFLRGNFSGITRRPNGNLTIRNAAAKTVCGKKRKKKQRKPSPRDGSGPRLTPDAVRGVGGLKKAIKLIKIKTDVKEERQGRRMPITKGFRRKKRAPEEIAAEREEMIRIENENAAHGESLYPDDLTDLPPMLVIDAYNVLAEMIKKDRRRFVGKELRDQREILEDDVQLFCYENGVKACLVYDALGNTSAESNHRETFLNIEMVYCTEYEADLGLRVESERLLVEGAQSIIVVSSDNDARDACSRPPVIECQSSRMFVNELDQIRRAVEELAELENFSIEDTSLRSALSDEITSELDQIRHLLDR